jgi:hypothetical protein
MQQPTIHVPTENKMHRNAAEKFSKKTISRICAIWDGRYHSQKESKSKKKKYRNRGWINNPAFRRELNEATKLVTRVSSFGIALLSPLNYY